jgi:hypothetical protein
MSATEFSEKLQATDAILNDDAIQDLPPLPERESMVSHNGTAVDSTVGASGGTDALPKRDNSVRKSGDTGMSQKLVLSTTSTKC